MRRFRRGWESFTATAVFVYFLRSGWSPPRENHQRRTYSLRFQIVITIYNCFFFSIQDIAGIVYTIYESIGKSVVVPYCGSKTINVRLTVSPDAKSKGSKASGAVISRKYRYKSRKLIPAGVEPEQGRDLLANVMDKPDLRVPPTTPEASPAIQIVNHGERKYKLKYVNGPVESHPIVDTDRCCATESVEAAVPCKIDNRMSPTKTASTVTTTIRNNCADAENVYESVEVLKCCSPKPAVAEALLRLEDAQNEVANYSCRECSSQCPLIDVSSVKMAASKPRKIMRKSRSKKQKTPKSSQARVRSLSVGNENCYQKNGDGALVVIGGISGKTIDGGEECLNNLRRNDLIDIIRESMEKNRLCFQTNG